MASPKTLEARAAKQQRKQEKKQQRELLAAMEGQREQQRAAVQMITALAGQIYSENVVLAPAGFDGTPKELYDYYEGQVHRAMDAAIAFVRAQNTYDDRGRVKDLPPVVAAAPVDANGSPAEENA